MDCKCDVAIIGAGPAGCAAAITCLQAGLSVVLIEAKPAGTYRPGESLHPGVGPIMRQLGVEDRFMRFVRIRYPGHYVTWGDTRRFSAFGEDANGPWLGYQIDRVDLENVLTDRVEELGGQVRRPCRAIRHLLNGSRITGVVTTDGTILCDRLFDASGATHWLSKSLRTSILRVGPKRVARYGHIPSGPGKDHLTPELTVSAVAWTWKARVSETRIAWVTQPWKAYNVSKDALLGTGHDTLLGAAEVTWRMTSSPAAFGYFVIGDAALVTDPLAGHGVVRALVSGVTAAHHVLASLRAGIPEQASIVAYTEWLRSLFDREIAKLSWYYASIDTPSTFNKDVLKTGSPRP